MTDSRRVLLQTKLETLLGSRNVYFNPPESISLSFPAIVYSLSNKYIKRANDKIYLFRDRYDITYMHLNPDDPFINSLLDAFEYSSFDRQIITKNLYNDYFTIYF